MKTNINEVKKNLAEFAQIWNIELNQRTDAQKNRLNYLATYLVNEKIHDHFLRDQLSPKEDQYFEFAVILANSIK